ncbi:MAG: Druantia anti-phage system protein DruA [Candidatus Methylumidiphilus sp.]
MSEQGIIQGRFIGEAEMAQLRAMLAGHPDWSRRRISEHLARLWDWRNPAGQLKDMAARTLLLKLERRGLIELPVRRQIPSNRMGRKSIPTPTPFPGMSPVNHALADLLPLTLNEISRQKLSGQRACFEALLQHHHYLGHRGSVGENLQYLVLDRQGQPLACVLFGAAAWQCKARDQHIGWDAPTRQRRLGYVTNNTRFLILPKVPHLASHVLGSIVRRLSQDWQHKYGHPIHLLETFVDTSRFHGTCYRASNWIHVGQTTGRTRQNKSMIPQSSQKAVWLYPLRSDYRQALCAS